MRIAHLSAEVSPFAKTGGLGDVAGALPRVQAEMGHDVSVWMPFYRQVRTALASRGLMPEVIIPNLQLDLGFRTWDVGLLRAFLPDSLVPVFLVACDPLFDRETIYSPGPWGDDGLLRYSVLVRAALESMRRLQMVPEVMHAHDWHCALAPMALAWDHPRDWHFDRTISVMTIHNAAYQGVYSVEGFQYLGLPRAAMSEPGLLWGGAINLLKGGVLAADVITAVSPTFAREITTREGGFGLEPVLQYRGSDLVGIANGIDTKVWSPSVDARIPARYDVDHPGGKRADRHALLKRAWMDTKDDGFVVALIGRLTDQKGYDLFFPVIDDLLRDGIRFVFLGSGDSRLESAVEFFTQYRPGRFWGHVGFEDELAHLMEAGADAFLMPSRFEPCGLNQLYSQAYGTPPIVRRVGGLADTVVSYDGFNLPVATGFGFDAPESFALRETVRWAHRTFRDSRAWTQIVRNGMLRDSSWERSAGQYLGLYEAVRRRKGL